MMHGCKMALWGGGAKGLGALMVSLSLLPQAGAQSLRDPTVPPASAGLTDAAGGARRPSIEPRGPLSIIVVDGRPHVMLGTRLYAQGQKLGQARIERITETEVWLREGGELRKVPQFAGVQRRTLSQATAAPVCVSGSANTPLSSRASKTSPPAAACDGIQP